MDYSNKSYFGQQSFGNRLNSCRFLVNTSYYFVLLALLLDDFQQKYIYQVSSIVELVNLIVLELVVGF